MIITSRGLTHIIQSFPVTATETRAKWSDIEKALEEVWKVAQPYKLNRYILVGPRAAKLFRKYRPRPNFCKRKFKRRSKRK